MIETDQNGIILDGALVGVPGVVCRPPASHGGPSTNALDPGDYRPRTTWIRQIIVHTTKGIWPQPIRAGKGAGGEGARVADFWRGDPAHSAAALVVDTAGVVDCLCDLARIAPWHAETSSQWSVGIEMYQLASGAIYAAQIEATALLVDALAARLGIPQWYPRGPYRGAPLRRMEVGTGAERRQSGGPDVLGCLGHRNNTERRGRGDPGDEIFRALAALGWRGVDYDGGEDLAIGRVWQARLNALDARAGLTWRPLVVDGVCGPASLAAMRRRGFARWRDVA